LTEPASKLHYNDDASAGPSPMKAVFDTKPNSGYDDEITGQYHFPARSNYMVGARGARGDWIVYREPQRNNGRRA
jgi:putative restriction endonuclease